MFEEIKKRLSKIVGFEHKRNPDRLFKRDGLAELGENGKWKNWDMGICFSNEACDFIAHAKPDIELLLLHIEDRDRVFDEMLNDLWALVYPDDPKGWEYPGQVYRHVRDYINELKVGKANKQMESRLKRMGFHDLEGNSPR